MPTIRTAPVASDEHTTNKYKISMHNSIALRDENKNPFTSILMRLKKKSIRNTTRRWLTDVFRPITDTLNGAVASIAETTWTVDNPDFHQPGDLLQVFDSREVAEVVSISGSDMTMLRNVVNASSGEPGYPTALLDEDYITRIGNTNREGARAPGAKHTLEVEYSNVSQIQRTVLHLTNTHIQMLSNVEQPLPYELMKKTREHKDDLEFQHLFGMKPRTIASTGSTKAKRYAAGADWYLRKYGDASRVVSITTVTEDSFMDWIRHVYRYGESNKKTGFFPPILIDGIMRWAVNHLQVFTDTKVFGIDIKKWRHPHGPDLGIINHKRLEGPVEGGSAYNNAFIFEFGDLSYCYVMGRDTALLTGREANDEDATKQELLTESCLEMLNFHFHGEMYGFTGFAA